MKFRRRTSDLFGRAVPDNFEITFDRNLLAEVLWEYGEDELAARASQLSDRDLEEIQRLVAWHHVNDPEEERPRLLGGRIMSRGAIDFFEGEGRDTKRRRRRTRPRDEGYLRDS